VDVKSNGAKSGKTAGIKSNIAHAPAEIMVFAKLIFVI
jgi:hypothetical protein